ncbi:putative motility protein [Gayadomonas joobiniege]|uniref:putative motility protein n=1 Tax=Gayadomonas joobiniege TaxID=1234606 RepID=UPI000382E67A|nr:putative motility protein [Gayadomonas joobiniege]
MDINPANTSMTGVQTPASAELRGAQLAKDQQQAEGQASLKLLESAAPAPSADPAIGQNINIKV